MKTFQGYFSNSNTIEGWDTLRKYNNDIDEISNSDETKTLAVFSTENVFERTGGLLRLTPLKKDQGLLINKCNSIHTFGMTYSLDVVYLNSHLKVVKLVKNIKPKRMSFSLRAKHTLELLAGEISRLDIKKNMTLMLDVNP
jgi:uncharacterized membrane protein (UPF0127 family)